MEARLGHGTPGSPLAATLERISAISMEDEEIQFSALLGVPDEPGWVMISGLVESPETLGDIMTRIERAYGRTDRAYAGTSLLRYYLWRMLAPVVAAFLTERRLPDLRAQNVALRFAENGFAEGLAFVGPRFAALPGDPDSSHPDAVGLSSEQELLGWLRGALAETHLPTRGPACRCAFLTDSITRRPVPGEV